MDVRSLTAVLAVVDHGGFTAAARSLHVSQPALSQTVRALEAELGTPLFHRIGRRVSLTAAGEALVEPARQVIRDLATVRARVDAVVGLRLGALDLVALPTLAVDPTAAFVGRFRAAHPGVVVRLAESEGDDDLLACLLDGRSEVGVTDSERVPDGLEAHVLLEQRFRLVCPPGTPTRPERVTVRSLADRPIVTTPPGSSTRRLIDRAFAAAGLLPSVAVETASREALLPLVLAGAGATLLPAATAADAARRGAVVLDLDVAPTRTVVLLHRGGPLSPAAAAFVALALSAGGGR